MDKLKIFLLFFCIIFLSSSCLAKTQKEEYQNDYLYSEEYFDYLIECASYEAEETRRQEKESKTIKLEPEEITASEDVISDKYEPFKLRIENNSNINPYGETFKKVDSKTIIPVGKDKFSIVQDTIKTRNKYNSNDYRILAGAEFTPSKYFVIASGLETNYRGIDQNPTSKKLYFTPSVHITDKISLSFHNKINVQSKSTDHDLGLKISPFKSKVMDFGVYAGLTRNPTGTHSESVNFSTSFYFF